MTVYAGGLEVDAGGSANLTDGAVVSNNQSVWWGGGVSNFGALTLTNMTVSGNHSNLFGAGIHTSSATGATLTNVTVSGNTSDDQSGGISNSGT